MPTQSNNPVPRLALMIGFALVCVALTIAVYKSFGGALPLASRGYRVEIPLPNAQSVVAGSDVRTSGVKIGRVVAVRRAGDRAYATVELDPQFVPMRTDATAIVRLKTLLGEGYVEIAPGPPSAAPIPENGRLAAGHVRTTVTLDDFLRTFPPQTRQRMRDLFAGVDTAFNGQAASLNDSLGNGAPLTADLNSVVRAASGQTAQLQRLFASSGDVLEAVGSRARVLQDAVTATNDLLDITASRNRELAATVRELPPFLRSLRGTAGVVTAASPDLDRAAVALSPVAAPLGRVVDQTLVTAPRLRSVFHALGPATAAAKQNLPALTRLVVAIKPTLRSLYPSLRELIPTLQLLGTYREAGLIGPLATVSSAINGNLVGPGGKIVTHAGGTLYVANESVGGWVKRLPTDRSNPYPMPDALRQISKQGFLSAYDCRHTKNPLYLPPLGTGVPPCVTQGAWNYRGTTAYYPRLARAQP